MKKRGFTIIELIMVLAIIAILLTVVVTALASSIQQARRRRSESACAVVQAGLATFYAQKDRWPGAIGEKIRSGSLGSRTNSEGYYGENNPNLIVLTAEEVREMIREMVRETKRGNPIMDISGLFVSRDRGDANGKGRGMDFREAIRGTKQSKKKMSLSEMHFGYPEAARGYFRRFKVTYSIPTDTMKVGQQ
jgi:prepilin-type N-terminal cleavage/methylation domain-containing protein